MVVKNIRRHCPPDKVLQYGQGQL